MCWCARILEFVLKVVVNDRIVEKTVGQPSAIALSLTNDVDADIPFLSSFRSFAT